MMVSNCPRCQIVRGVKLSSPHGRCQIVLFCMMVSNCPRCQIVCGVKLSHHPELVAMLPPTPNFELTTGQVFVHFVPIIRELAPFSSLPGASPFLPCFAPFLRCLPSMRCNVDENCLHLIGPFTAHKSSLHFDL